MKLHSDTLTTTDIREALATVKRQGFVADQVYFAELDSANSRSHANAWEIGLEAHFKSAGEKRFRRMHKRDEWAATYNEWGYFIARLFEVDPEMKFGNYKGADDFHQTTRYAFK